MTLVRDIPYAIADIGRMDFRTSSAADSMCGAVQRGLGVAFRYPTARMAIARSLSVASIPPPPADVTGRSIRGETLFGKEPAEQALWVALIVEHAGGSPKARKELQDLVAAHWARGAATLGEQWRSCEGDFLGFAKWLVAERR